MVLRSFWNVCSGLIKKRLVPNNTKGLASLDYPVVWKSRPGFWDIDLNLHMNNAAFLYNAELARWYSGAYSGMMDIVFRHKYAFIVGSTAIRFRHGILPFQPYEIHSKIVYYDDQWMFMSQKFIETNTGKICAESICRFIIKNGKKTVVPQELAAMLGAQIKQSPPMPNIVKGYLAWDKYTEDNTKLAQLEQVKDHKKNRVMEFITGGTNNPYASTISKQKFINPEDQLKDTN